MKGDTRSRRRPGASVRRSVVIARRVLEDALRLAPPELRHNVNGLIRAALEQYVIECRERAFAMEMQQMARDPAISRLNRRIAQEFRRTESDALRS